MRKEIRLALIESEPILRGFSAFSFLSFDRIKSQTTIVVARKSSNVIFHLNKTAPGWYVCPIAIARNTAPLNYPSYLPADILEIVLRGGKRIIPIMSRRVYTCQCALTLGHSVP